MRVENYEREASHPRKKNKTEEDQGTSERNTSGKGPEHGWMKEQRSGHDFVWMIFEVHMMKMRCMIRNTQGDKGSL